MYEAGEGGGAGGAEGRAAGWAVRRGRQRPGRGRGGAGGALLRARAPTFHLARLRSGVGGRGLVFQPRPPVTVRLPECGAVLGEREGREWSRGWAGCQPGPARALGVESGCVRADRPAGRGGRALQVHERPRRLCASPGREWGSSEQGAGHVGRVIT